MDGRLIWRVLAEVIPEFGLQRGDLLTLNSDELLVIRGMPLTVQERVSLLSDTWRARQIQATDEVTRLWSLRHLVSVSPPLPLRLGWFRRRSEGQRE